MLNVEPRGFDFFVGCCIFHSLFATMNEKKTFLSALTSIGTVILDDYIILFNRMLAFKN